MNENNQFTNRLLLLLFLSMGFIGGYILGQSPIAPYRAFPGGSLDQDTISEFRPLIEVWNLVNQNFYRQPIDRIALVEGAINGMLETLDDRHTRYLSPEVQQAAESTFEGELQGIGVEVENIEGAITVVAPIDGSPAQAAGLQPGDILRQADGVELTGMDISEAATLVRGPAGTAVNLLIERAGDTFLIEIIRDVIKLESVRGEIIEDDIAYIRLSRFANDTDEDLKTLLEQVMAENPQGMILDLRRNPGGSLTTVVNISDEFLDEGVILYESFGDEREIFESQSGDLAEDIPLVVLVDEGSASASEVLAGAIQDRGRGILIGQTTFGKGTVQSWQSLSNGGGVRITIAQWLTPNEAWIHDNGLTPNFFIPLPALDNEFEDTQLQAAIDYLKGEEILSIPPEALEE